MRKTILTLVVATGLLLPLKATAQGTLYLSSLGYPSTGSNSVGSDHWVAVLIEGYTDIYAIQLLMSPASGNPAGFSVSIYDVGSDGNPRSSLGSLSGLDPSAGGLFTYYADDVSGIIVPGHNFFIVVTATTPIAQGAYNWDHQTSGESYRLIGRSFMLGSAFSADGSTWAYPPQESITFAELALYGSAVPEPSTFALLGLGLAALSFWRRRR